ncbi:MAG: hypothetical protein IJK31_03110 [Ruminococcus sp.]|nr:hypothetical protein [Ruminococcus sp.]HRR78090.1 hypothetical protein [Ruminococcus sp.]
MRKIIVNRKKSFAGSWSRYVCMLRDRNGAVMKCEIDKSGMLVFETDGRACTLIVSATRSNYHGSSSLEFAAPCQIPEGDGVTEYNIVTSYSMLYGISIKLEKVF